MRHGTCLPWGLREELGLPSSWIQQEFPSEIWGNQEIWCETKVCGQNFHLGEVMEALSSGRALEKATASAQKSLLSCATVALPSRSVPQLQWDPMSHTCPSRLCVWSISLNNKEPSPSSVSSEVRIQDLWSQ